MWLACFCQSLCNNELVCILISSTEVLSLFSGDFSSSFFTARRIYNAIYAARCVCLSVCPSHWVIHREAVDVSPGSLAFSDAKDKCENVSGATLSGV